MKPIEYRAKAQIGKVKAQRYGAFLARMSKRGPLDARRVVEAARPKNSAIHDWFEWREGVAAEKYRELQAQHLLRIIVHTTDAGQRERAFLNVHVSGKSVYLPTIDVMSNEEYAGEVLAQALTYLRWFRRKYDGLKQLAVVYGAIDKVLVSHKP